MGGQRKQPTITARHARAVFAFCSGVPSATMPSSDAGMVDQRRESVVVVGPIFFAAALPADRP